MIKLGINETSKNKQTNTEMKSFMDLRLKYWENNRLKCVHLFLNAPLAAIFEYIFLQQAIRFYLSCMLHSFHSELVVVKQTEWFIQMIR